MVPGKIKVQYFALLKIHQRCSNQIGFESVLPTNADMWQHSHTLFINVNVET